MGGIWLSRIELVTSLSEFVGAKAGIALTRQQMLDHAPDYSELLGGDDDDVLRVRSETVEELFGDLLYAVGNVASPGITFPVIDMYHKYKNDDVLGPLQMKVAGLFNDMSPYLIRTSEREGKPVNPGPFLEVAKSRWGVHGSMLALQLVERIQDKMHRSPWAAHRRYEWRDLAQLTALFESENLGSQHGEFFDQRFVDYLHRNDSSIDNMHWRQFEGLAAEFFDRLGFKVQIGDGRNDDGVDVRVWRDSDDATDPPAILVQCKRTKEKVGKVVVKGLYADVINEKAESGLIVTSTSLSAGARQTCLARAYPIGEANRDALKEWLDQMRSPHSGVFMGP